MFWQALKTRLLPAIGLLGLLAIACGASAEPFKDLNGTFWSSQGFGYVLQFDQSESFVLYQVAPPLGSIRVLEGTLDSESGTAAQLVGNASSAISDADEVLGTLRISDNQLRLRREDGLDEIVFSRLPERPPILDQAPDASPQGVFKYFRRLVESHHAFLQQRLDELAIPAGLWPRGTTWDVAAAAAANQIGRNTSRQELCNALWNLLAPLGDAHTSLSDPENDQCDYAGDHPRTFATMFPGTPVGEVGNDQINERVDEALEIVAREFVDARGLASIANDKIQYGVIRGRPILYMRIVSFSNFARGDDFEAERENLQKGLDEAAALYAAESLTAVILDLRTNDGGSDALGIEIASRFNNAPYIAYRETARQDPNDPASFTPPQTMQVPVSARPGFREAPVVILTSRLTVSAGETFAMAMMERGRGEKKVLRIGEPTQGVYADVLSLQLPNGMILGIPNERYLTSAGKNWEIHGIPPDIEVPVWAPADLEANRDPALQRAIEELSALR